MLAFVLLMIILVGCKAYYTESAVGRDTLFSVEKQKNGSWRIWMTHDDVSAYCTVDDELGELALDIIQNDEIPEVVFMFNDIEWEDETAGGIWNTSICGQGIYETKVWALLDLRRATGR